MVYFSEIVLLSPVREIYRKINRERNKENIGKIYFSYSNSPKRDGFSAINTTHFF